MGNIWYGKYHNGCTTCGGSGTRPYYTDKTIFGWIPCPQCNRLAAPKLPDACSACQGWSARNWDFGPTMDNRQYWEWTTTPLKLHQLGSWQCPVCGGEGTMAAAIARRLEGIAGHPYG